ncbi:sensor histidine kinase [Cupriavidus basilensis]
MLDSSQLLDGGRLATLQGVDFSLAMLVHEVCEMHRESSPAAVIEETIEPGVGENFHGDAKLLFQAISNLIGNAIKYSPDGRPGCSAAIRGHGGDQRLRVRSRHGHSRTRPDRDQIFERFVRGGNVAGTAGAGVGLYLVKLAVDLHGGKVVVTSKERGRALALSARRAAPRRAEGGAYSVAAMAALLSRRGPTPGRTWSMGITPRRGRGRRAADVAMNIEDVALACREAAGMTTGLQAKNSPP